MNRICCVGASSAEGMGIRPVSAMGQPPHPRPSTNRRQFKFGMRGKTIFGSQDVRRLSAAPGSSSATKGASLSDLS